MFEVTWIVLPRSRFQDFTLGSSIGRINGIRVVYSLHVVVELKRLACYGCRARGVHGGAKASKVVVVGIPGIGDACVEATVVICSPYSSTVS